MQNLVNHIISYLNYLQDDCHWNITIHEFQKITAPFLTLFLPYRLHSNPYCIYLKSHPEIWDDCIDKQRRLLPLLENGPIWGTCHCGVTEYVYPLRQTVPEVRLLGFISVSGYRSSTETASGKLKHACEKYDLNYESVHALYDMHLSPELPDSHLLDTLLYPLSSMLEELYHKECLLCGGTPEQAQDTAYFLNQILLYIEKNFHRQISIQDICTALHCSRSYVSHTFKASTGYNFREYINLLRLEEAKKLLANTSFSITEVSLKTGFSNSNYFSSLFHNYSGMSPMEYRRRC